VKKAIGLAVVMVLAATLAFSAIGATSGRSPHISYPHQDRCFNGFEVDLQMGVPFPHFVEADLGLLTRGYFNLGAGVSFANFETQDMVGGYAKIGIFTFDILKGKCLIDPDGSGFYWEGKIKIPLSVFAPDNSIWPLSFGWKFSEMFISGERLAPRYSQQRTFFVGIDAVFDKIDSEIWLEWQFPKEFFVQNRRCYLRDLFHLELGFAIYL